jgi:ABC-2 type transport system ATP-binding protein
MVVPTGVGCRVGGFAGDALPAARLLGAASGCLITHPNVLNAAALYWNDPRLHYVEGWALNRFAAGELALAPGRRQRVGLVLDQCGLTDVRKKIIGSLSKGFRQRVGLADALVHNPMLLILDEPTAGLDPHQIRSFRELIKELGKDRTILLSTHILSEVEMVCGRAIIINKGKIEASDTLANLEKRVQAGALQIEVKADPALAKEKLGKIAEVSVVAELNRAGDWISFEVTAAPGKDIRGEVDGLIKREQWPLREFRREKARLEDVFVELTQD